MPDRKDSDIIGQGPRDAARGGDSARPWAQQKGNEGHAQAAPLWHAAYVPMGFPKSTGNNVAVVEFGMICL